jgi:hypothetical protein
MKRITAALFACLTALGAAAITAPAANALDIDLGRVCVQADPNQPAIYTEDGGDEIPESDFDCES